MTWERIGFDTLMAGLATIHGDATDGSQDTLFATVRITRNRGVYRYERDGTWTRMHDEVGDGFESLADGTLLSGVGSGSASVEFSRDGGRTWTDSQSTEPFTCSDMDHAHESALAPPVGAEPGARPALYTGGSGLCRSTDGGDVYAPVPFDDAGDTCEGGRPFDAADLPPSAAFPDGRLLVAVYNGMGYSTTDADGGLAFTCSSFWSPFRWGVDAVEVHPNPAHPYGGTAYAILKITGTGFPGIYASEDGGETYQERRTFTQDTFIRAPQSLAVEVDEVGRLIAGIDGVDILDDGTFTDDRGVVVWSGDGGRTWHDLTGEGSGWGGHGVLDVELARDGRIYAATQSGVWRTVEAVNLPVSSDPEPPAASGAGLRITPNPASGAVRIALSLNTPDAATLRIYDTRGREVHVEASGARGEHAWEVRTAGWAAGVYVVRVEIGAEIVSAHLTVAR